MTLSPSASLPQPPASPASPNLPNVFVIPPEEEHAHDPPWCAFDAHGELHTSPDLTALGSALAPVFDRHGVGAQDVVMPSRRPGSIVLAPRDDSFGDSIEIVRVGRGEAEPSPEKVPPSKRPKTLAARAANALRSIKNVGRPKAASAPAAIAKPARKSVHVKDVFPASASEQNAPPSQQQPRRRKSIVLSQLFTAPLRNKSSFDLHTPPAVDVDASTIALPPSPSSPNRPMSLSLSIRPTSTSSLNLPLSPSEQDLPEPTPRPQSAGPAPRPQSLLRRMLSFTSVKFASPSVPGTPSTPTLLTPDDDDADYYGRELPLLPSPYPESEPDAEVVELDVELEEEEEEVMALRHVPSVSHGSLVSRASKSTTALSFDDSADLVDAFGAVGEMRLDSLHFDSLSFDPENFNV